MADVYWVGVAAGWDDGVVGVATPWASTSGGSDNVAAPVDGDSVFFDGGGFSTEPTSGPTMLVSLVKIDLTGANFSLSASVTANLTLTGIDSNLGSGSSDFAGILGAASSIIISGGCSLNAAATVVSGASITFGGSATNNCSFNTSGTVSFADDSINAADFTATFVNCFGGGTNVTNNAVITAAVTIIGRVIGTGSFIGNVTVTANEPNPNNALPITGNLTMSGGGNSGSVSGNLTMTGGGNGGLINGNATISLGENGGIIMGDCILSGSGRNTGTVNGTLTVPYAQTFGAAAWGAWATLNITGLPSGSSPILGGLL